MEAATLDYIRMGQADLFQLKTNHQIIMDISSTINLSGRVALVTGGGSGMLVHTSYPMMHGMLMLL